jgi:hypothetical protein
MEGERMIYHMHFIQMSDKQITGWAALSLRPLLGTSIDGRKFVATFIEESTEDTFIFILTHNNGQDTTFNKWVEKYGLEEYIVFTPPTLITNSVHSEAGPNLRLVVMASKDHPWHDMYLDDETEGENDGD